MLAAHLCLAAASYAQTQPAAKTPAIVGGWTLNKDLSDVPADRSQQGEDQVRGSGRGGGGGGYGRHGGGYGRGGGGGSATSNMTPEERERMRDAMRDVMGAADHLIITESSGMVIITTGEGHVTRLSTDGKKIKDENTNVERKTKWDAEKLVCEISGLGSGKITQTYSVEPEKHQLHITLVVPNPRQSQPTTLNRVYDSDSAQK